MTCIVGIAHKGRVYIGGDSAGVAGYDIVTRSDEKIFPNGDFLFGFCGSFRMGQLLRYALVPPSKEEGQDIYAYMVTRFIDAVRECLKAGGYASKDKEVEEGGDFLVGYNGRLFRIESDYQVGESSNGYDAIGCGESYALGSLYMTNASAPHGRVTKALDAAEYFSAGVRGPFHIMSI